MVEFVVQLPVTCWVLVGKVKKKKKNSKRFVNLNANDSPSESLHWFYYSPVRNISLFYSKSSNVNLFLGNLSPKMQIVKSWREELAIHP